MKKELLKYIENDQFLEARQKIDEILLLMIPEKATIYYIVENAVVYMKERYAQELSLRKVAQWVGVTPNYLSKIFVQHMGVHFSSYLNFIRVKQAEILLLKTDLTVAAIAEMVGYMETSYFIRVFRQYTHCTPAQFRCIYHRHKNAH